MAVCRVCGEKYKQARADLGYQTCVKCGQVEAQLEIQKRSTRIIPSHNKGTLTYMGSDDATIRRNLKELGCKYGRGDDIPSLKVFSGASKPIKKEPPKPIRREFAGVKRINGEIVIQWRIINEGES